MLRHGLRGQVISLIVMNSMGYDDLRGWHGVSIDVWHDGNVTR